MRMQRSLLTIALEIARDKFKENAASVAHRGIALQFERQAKETQEAIDSLENADAIAIHD